MEASKNIDVGMLVFFAIIILGAGSNLLSAFFFPQWKATWGRTGRVPISVRGKIALGIYSAYFLLPLLVLSFVSKSRTLEFLFFIGWAVLMVVVYREYRRDRHAYEESLK
jgi:hypothetical protein